MATGRLVGRRSTAAVKLGWYSTLSSSSSSSKKGSSHHEEHKRNQVYLKPSAFIGSWHWQPPSDPKAAQAKLAELRRDYAKQLKETRKHFIYEMELQRQDQIRKDEARRDEILRQREVRLKSKSAAAQARAAHRKAFEEDFSHTLMKEREAKLDYWRKREKAIQEKTISKREVIRKQSSMWIDENELEKAALDAIVKNVTHF